MSLLTPEEELERAELLEGIIETLKLLGDACLACHDMLREKATAHDIMQFHETLARMGANFNITDFTTHRIIEIDKDAIIRNN